MGEGETLRFDRWADVIIRTKGNHQVMTNFFRSKDESENASCRRYKLVKQSLADNKELTVDGCCSLLKAIAQPFTTYSTIFALTNGDVYVHHQGDFERTVKISLKKEVEMESALKIADR